MTEEDIIFYGFLIFIIGFAMGMLLSSGKKKRKK